MDHHPTIFIPSDLLPADGRFGSGPSKVNPQFVTDLAATGSGLLGTSHRRTTVRDIVGNVRAKIRDLYELPAGYEVVLGVGGATAFWDAAAFGLIERRSAHFVCGEFSGKFAEVSRGAPHLDEPVVIEASPGSAPVPVEVDGIDTAAFIHNETSTGVLAPFARFGDALVVVDGTSAAGAVPFDVSSVDAYYFSPQKALGSEGGLWISLMSPGALDRIEELAASERWIPPFLSLSTAVDNSLKNQTYNTPAISTLYLLSAQLDHVMSLGGLAWAHARSAESASVLASWINFSDYATPFVADPALRSPTVTTADLDPSINADTVAAVLRANGIVDTESYRKLGRNQLRIATFPNIESDDVAALTSCIDWVVEAISA
jgi:phosphoserine aminotransferase